MLCVNPDRIPRFEIPDYVYQDDSEPDTGSCWNCRHFAEVTINGTSYSVCCRNRDDGSDGEVYHQSSPFYDCDGWEEVY